MSEAPTPECPDPLSEALRYAALGWRVVPIRRGEKRPPMNAWQHAASTREQTIQNWWNGLYRGSGVGIATGVESGIWVLDVDGATGEAALGELVQKHGTIPPTVTVITGSGGKHLYFLHPGAGVRITTNRSQLGGGLDVRGDGGQVLAPPTIHPNGTPYVFAPGLDPWSVKVARPPLWLNELAAEKATPPPSPSQSSDTDSIASWYNNQTTWDALLGADGWAAGKVRGDTQYWTRPGKDRREGASAVLHLPDGPFVIFTTDPGIGSLGLHQAAQATKSGDGWAYSRFGYYAARHHRGDRSEAARSLRAEQRQLDGAGIVLPPSPLVDPDHSPDDDAPLPWEDVALRGGDALRSIVDAPPARWGKGDRVLWARGESLLIAGRTGVGKTTLGQSVVAGLVGIDPTALGLPIEPATRVLYLAMDRPRQIMRSMRRRFATDAHLDVLDEKLILRKGPLPSDLAKNPGQLVEMARRYGCDVIVLDSLKDAAVKLTDDEVGGQVNRAIQMCNAVDIDVMVLHHQRKGDVTQRKDDESEPTIEDVFGSSWITAGTGSVIILHGQPGGELVKLYHVKQPAEPLGPWLIEHDHHAGTSRIVHGFDLVAFLKHRGATGATAVDAAKAEHQKEVKGSSREAARAKRRLDALVRDGIAVKKHFDERGTNGQPIPDRWYYDGSAGLADALDRTVTHARDGRSESRDGPVTGDGRHNRDGSVTGRDETDETAGHNRDGSVTGRDAQSRDGWGGIISIPPITASSKEHGYPQASNPFQEDF